MLTILIVDDTASCRRPLARLLKSVGYESVCADNGCEALKALEAITPALILLDLAMPVMDGITFLQALRNDHRWASLPVIVVSGESSGALERAKELGADEVLLKGGYRTDDLFASIRRLVARPGRKEETPAGPKGRRGRSPKPKAFSR